MLIYLQMIELSEDRTKFEEVFYQYKKVMFRTASRLLWNKEDAEDAVQQAFESIAKNIDKISVVDSPQTCSFVLIITERKAIDILRINQRHKVEELNESITGMYVPLPGDNGIADALARLPARYREILLLKYDNGFSTKELSEIFGISHSAAKKLVWRAKEALRNSLEKEGILV